MTGNETKTTQFALRDLLEMIAAGELALPDFQRSFSWEPANVRALLATVLRGWPAGSLMFVRHAPEFAGRPRPFEGAPVLSSGVEYLVLDGQQRLTALYQALYGRGKKAYFLQLPLDEPEDLWLDVEQLEERIVWADAGDLPRLVPGTVDIPFTSLRSPSAYLEWTESRDQGLPRLALTDLYRRLVSGLTSFQFPTVVLEAGVEAAAVARMFERVNATGMTLSAFDLVVARTFSAQPLTSWNLRSEFEAAIEEDPLLEAFLDDDGLPLLEAIALKTQRNVRRGAVIRLSAADVRQHWPTAVAAMRRVLEVLTTRFGVLTRDWLPYDAYLVVLTAYAMEFALEHHEQLIESWFWSRSFGSAFEVGVNTTIVREYESLVAATGGRALPVMESPPLSELLTATKASGSQLYRAFLCAMVAEDPVDPASLGSPDGERTLEFGDALTFPIVRSSAPGMRPSSRVRVVSQVAARRRPDWLGGRAALLNLAQQLGDRRPPQFLPGSDILSAPDLASETLWNARLERLMAFLRSRGHGALTLPEADSTLTEMVPRGAEGIRPGATASDDERVLVVARFSDMTTAMSSYKELMAADANGSLRVDAALVATVDSDGSIKIARVTEGDSRTSVKWGIVGSILAGILLPAPIVGDAITIGAAATAARMARELHQRIQIEQLTAFIPPGAFGILCFVSPTQAAKVTATLHQAVEVTFIALDEEATATIAAVVAAVDTTPAPETQAEE